MSTAFNVAVHAADSSATVVADEIWLVSSRHMSSNVACLQDPEQGLRVSRFDEKHRPQPSTLHDLLAPSATQIDGMYVHGNWMTQTEAIQYGISVLHRLRRSCPEGAPVRWIIWTWPSEKQGFGVDALRAKACRADAQAHYVAWLLKRLTTRGAPLRMIGYSFGSRVITGALHVCAGGYLKSAGLDEPPVTGLHARVGILAAAMDADWLGARNMHCVAGLNLESLTCFINPTDPALNLYWVLDSQNHTPAMGLRGPTQFPLNSTGDRVPVKLYNCSKCVGPSHDEVRYYDKCCDVAPKLARMVWEPEA